MYFQVKSFTLSRLDRRVGDLQGFVDRRKPLRQFCLGDNQGRDEQDGVPVGVHVHPAL